MGRRAGRPKNRLELRRQAEAAEIGEEGFQDAEAEEREVDAEVEEVLQQTTRKPVKKTVRVKKAKKVDPERKRMVWAIFNNSNEQIETFPFSEKSRAEQRIAELMEKEKSRKPFFLQPVKEAIPLDAEAE